MLSVHRDWRKRGIGECRKHCSFIGMQMISSIAAASTLVRRSLEEMKRHGAEEVNGYIALGLLELTDHFDELGRIGD